MTNPKPARPRITPGKVAFVLGCALVGGVVGSLAARSRLFDTGHLELSGAEGAALFALGVLLLPLLVLWHELGHMAGGRLAGFRPVLLVVGFVRWQKGDRGWRMSANRSAALAGGLAACVPQGSHDLVRRTATLIAGGPLASLVGAGAGLGAWAALPPLSGDTPFAVVAGYTALAVFGFGNLFLAAVSLTPTRTAGFYSDGARLLRMARGGPELDREIAILLLTGTTVGGIRPREWDAALVRRAVGEADGSLFHVMGLQFAFAHAHDRGDLSTAGEHVAALLAAQDAFPPILRPSLRLGVTYFVARHGGAPARARALVDESQGGLLIDAYIRHLAVAAAAWAGGDHARAAAELERAEAELPRAVDRGGAAAAADRIAELRALLRDAPVHHTAPAAPELLIQRDDR